MKASGNFLCKAEQTELVEIARDGLEEHRIARRANAIILLDRGMKFEEVAQVLLVDDSTVRASRKAFETVITETPTIWAMSFKRTIFRMMKCE